MQIDLSETGCLTLLLSDEELAALGLSFDELDYTRPETRRLLHSLLSVARRETGYAPEGSLLVEALPVEGGCLLLVTPEPSGTPVRNTAPTAFYITGADSLLQIAAAWPESRHPLGESSSLYRAGEDYWLILYGGAEAPVLYECAEPVADGAVAVAYVAEHGTPVFIGDALPRLHRLVHRA